MSTDYGYRCVDCDVSSPHWFNHGGDYLRALVEVAPDIDRIKKHLAGWDGWRIEINHLNVVDDPNLVEFLVQHQGHKIVIENEYGEVRDV